MKIIEDATLTIEGEVFTISPFPAFKGLKYLKQITKIVGPSVAILFAEGGKDNVVEQLGSPDKAVELLVQNFEGDSVENLIKELIKSVTKNGQELIFDLEFQADYGKLFKLITEVVKVNYGSVFQAGGLLSP